MYCPLQRHRRFGGSLLSVRPDELPASIMMIPGSTPNGGAIVPGHPLGMSGARLLPLNYKKGTGAMRIPGVWVGTGGRYATGKE